ncbi:MAG: TerC family protein [Deltaproteobacteria bacterium]|nr:TerC family protein [Deltaproteobacteria bacterium]
MSSESLISLLTLTALEIVLGIDNIVFISILAGKLPKEKRDTARKAGLMGALASRLALLSVMSWLVGLTTPLTQVGSFEITGKSLILFLGGLFLLWKATKEIHGKLEGEDSVATSGGVRSTLAGVIAQIMLIDVVFSIDSVITAVGMSQSLAIMVMANLIALIIMLFASGAISNLVEKHPTIKILALSFLLMIGLVLVGEGAGFHIPKGYVYFAMGFSVFVELINIKITHKSKPVKLHNEPH